MANKKIEIEIPRSLTGEKFAYEVPENEMKQTAHVYQEQIRFDSDSGQRMSKGHVQKYDRQGWDNFRKIGNSLGWTIKAIFIPKEWEDRVEPLKSVGKVSVQKPAKK